MQFLIVPAIIAIGWFFDFVPVPGFVYVMIGAMYLMVAIIEKHIIEAAEESRHRDNAILDRLESIEALLENKIDSVGSDVSDIQHTLNQLDRLYNPERTF